MAFWKPGTVAPGSTIDRETGNEDALAASSANQYAHLSLTSQRQRLPVYKQRTKLLHLVERYPVLIVVGQTGCGKTTQIPQYLFEAGWAAQGRVIGCTQPRRVAATSVAARVAQEVGSLLGDEVGYTIRFEDLSSPTRTRIKYMTDGMLFREAMLDPLLSKYSVIMIDEAHERSSYTDLLLGLLKKVRKKRPELRLIVSSATIDAQAFLNYFNSNIDGADRTQDDAAIISLEGRMYPVEVAYLDEPVTDYVRAAVKAVLDIHLKMPAGDILIFLTGREEIDRCAEDITEQMYDLPAGASKLLPLPLHAGLTSEQQLFVFEPAPAKTRKVVISTNIAEASITIDNIRYVIDSGFVKLRTFNPSTGMDRLTVTGASLASLNQRAGRAGRTSAGKCFRLFPEPALAKLPKSTPPEICRSDISLFLLQLKALGIDNVLRFDYLTPPPSVMLARALEFLYSLKALDDYGRLTRPLGMRMAEVPVDPMMAKILLDSDEFSCSQEILTIAAMTSVQNVFVTGEGGEGAICEIEKRKFTAEEGDHLTLLNVYNAFTGPGKQSAKWCHSHRLNFRALSRAISIRGQLRKYLQRFDIPIISCGEEESQIRKCLVSGYFKNAAKMQPDGTYQSLRDRASLSVHPSSVMFTRVAPTGYVIFHEVIETTKSFMRDITVVDQDWLKEYSGGYYVAGKS
ncbi:uncharacterized protein L969DRAFT_16014 [Mixia osmundae IAM 14324]|uniref:uncharacterized protein n=1 Tax=Mixia osmundae (strain CBS 9802 / IAM 14324 / JCM 22182 / KY 12970) TaxID=764103 RepID=UPI0004A5487B|nr:uncharacterized protein L969DRAFT_16014 [Mixia osmundae IAM 14324]KEI40652.1 hypothetical protein L969DRAFT_16014 [Mixia osmundae IAM 14324]